MGSSEESRVGSSEPLTQANNPSGRSWLGWRFSPPQTVQSAVCYDIESAVGRNRVQQQIPDLAMKTRAA